MDTAEDLDISKSLTIGDDVERDSSIEDVELKEEELKTVSLAPSLSDDSDENSKDNGMADSIDSNSSHESDSLSYSSDEEEYIKKFDESTRTNIIENFHRELKQTNYDEISALTKIVRDKVGNVIDSVHSTIPFLTKFEQAKVLGLRAKQLNSGADPFISVSDNIIEGHIIAEMELKQKKIPFIISRPLPNGKNEYWKVSDLELIDY